MNERSETFLEQIGKKKAFMILKQALGKDAIQGCRQNEVKATIPYICLRMNLDDQYNELAYYTLSHKGKDFIHQHIVDAFAIQTANEHTKPIKITYALIGIYLHIEKGYTGKQVQVAHVEMSKKSKVFPKIILPTNRGEISIADVLKITDAEERDKLIHGWCETIWKAFASQQELIKDITESLL